MMKFGKDFAKFSIHQSSYILLILQRVPINIVHEEINDFLKSRSDKQVKFYNILKLLVLFIIGENF